MTRNRAATRLFFGVLIFALAVGAILFAGGYDVRALVSSPEAQRVAELGAGDRAARLDALKSLRGSELSPAAIRTLLPLLADEDPQVGYQAALALGESRNPAAREALLLALSHSNPVVRIRAAEALSLAPTADAAPLLAQLLLHNDDAALSAARALVKIDNDVARNALWVSLGDEQQTPRLRAVMQALLENGDASVTMLRQAQLSALPSLRTNATLILAQIQAS